MKDRTWIELSREAVSFNLKNFRSLIPAKTRLAAIVKSNAYGHGLLEMAELAVEGGADLLGVNSLEEAIPLRKRYPNLPILIMGEIPDLEYRRKEVSDPNYWIIVSRTESVRALAKCDPSPQIHLKVDTGMGRLGSFGEELEKIFSELKKEGLPIHGIATHFASTEDVLEQKYSKEQTDRFNEAIRIAEKYGFTSLIKHACASASTMLFPEAHHDLVRIGISLYGLWPSLQTRLSLHLTGKKDFRLSPVLAWKTRIVHLKDLPEDSYVGYGSTYQTSAPTKVAVVPVGYYEGLDRKLSNNGVMLVRGKKAKILGRICMNMTMLDVTHIHGVEIGDTVTVIGKDGEEEVSADDHANWTYTINYEVTTRISESVPKTVI
ncbi:alanine racemase [Leptospira wolffii]|uniref:Alanine racemase n=1 Tax=Leptospira wolffii TaxID=409998 RepID=A0A2M9ZCE9_9LEPT|nr:alanine racemase [Leptospira wolffii]EPG65901.1 alanine racemase [Leptospira wolffii serovar Khorat str. Khorat-H2]PJZ66032.1 alanine racemase [Leptospira wolffii]TGK59240.1 alanine racemase [Leptospira wolffii]TGK71073.1 alanine racemase [Leptospira wolffii]TGK71379.1 alanine racemase [Leptospira wolffii]